MSQTITGRKQQELQVQYTNYKNGLQQIAQKMLVLASKLDYVQMSPGQERLPKSSTRKDYILFMLFRAATDISVIYRGDVESEAEEHKLVLETLEPLPEDRKCFRMINGVLVERTVKDVIPALKTNSEGLRKVLEDLVKQYNSKQAEMEKWKKKNNIQVVQQ